NADSRAHEARQRAPEIGGEAEIADRLGDLISLLAGGNLDTCERLGTLEGRQLREVDDVDGCLVGLKELFDRLMHGRRNVFEVQRNRAVDARDGRGRAARSSAQVESKPIDIAEGRRHEDELRARKGKK